MIVIMVGVVSMYSISGKTSHKINDQPLSVTFSSDTVKMSEPITNMANPAAVYCQELGYIYRMQEDSEGSWGECILPDEVCDAWEFLGGECGVDYSYCARLGLKSIVFNDGMNAYSHHYALCVSEDGVINDAVTDLFEMEKKISKFSCAGKEIGSDNAQMVTGIDVKDSTGDRLSDGLPSSFDWRNYQGENWLPPIRDQGSCGSCWAFSAIGVAEAAMKIFHGNPAFDIDLSEQYLVSDCDLESGNCCGGFKSLALGFITENGVPDEGCMTYVTKELLKLPGISKIQRMKDDNVKCAKGVKFNIPVVLEWFEEDLKKRNYTPEELPKGISLRNGSYQVRKTIDGKRKSMGTFETLEKAILALG